MIIHRHLTTFIALLSVTTLYTSATINHGVLQRAQGSFTRMAAQVDLIPSLAGTQEDAAMQRMTELQTLLNTLITEREHLNPCQREMVNGYIAFFASLTPEQLASMNHLEAEDVLYKLHTLHTTLQPHLVPQRGPGLPTAISEALRTLELHTSMLLEPAYYQRASVWQQVKHVARNPERHGISSTKIVAIAAATFVGVAILGNTLTITEYRAEPSSDNPIAEFKTDLVLAETAPAVTTIKSLQTTALKIICEDNHPSDSRATLPHQLQKWLTKAEELRTLNTTTLSDKKAAQKRIEIFEHLAAYRYASHGRMGALILKLTGIDTRNTAPGSKEYQDALRQAAKKVIEERTLYLEKADAILLEAGKHLNRETEKGSLAYEEHADLKRRTSAAQQRKLAETEIIEHLIAYRTTAQELLKAAAMLQHQLSEAPTSASSVESTSCAATDEDMTESTSSDLAQLSRSLDALSEVLPPLIARLQKLAENIQRTADTKGINLSAAGYDRVFTRITALAERTVDPLGELATILWAHQALTGVKPYVDKYTADLTAPILRELERVKKLFRPQEPSTGPSAA